MSTPTAMWAEREATRWSTRTLTRIASVVDHREEDSSSGRVLPLQDSLGYRVGDPRNGPRAEHPR